MSATSDPYERYKKWHWGNEATQTIDWKDSDIPSVLVGIGNLHELHTRPIGGGKVDELVFQDGSKHWIAFDHEHPHERLYLLLSEDAKKDIRNMLVKKNGEWWDLKSLSQAAGGKQSKMPYPDIEVQPIGELTHVVYYTDKKGDGLSQYIHEFGEESGIVPILAADRKGRLWIAGGNMTSPYAGITD